MERPISFWGYKEQESNRIFPEHDDDDDDDDDVFIWKQTATCVTYSINWLVFITEMKSVYSAVRTGPLNKAVCASSLKS
jgi:hypothetical protein